MAWVVVESIQQCTAASRNRDSSVFDLGGFRVEIPFFLAVDVESRDASDVPPCPSSAQKIGLQYAKRLAPNYPNTTMAVTADNI
jgi:hypothetical protein